MFNALMKGFVCYLATFSAVASSASAKPIPWGGQAEEMLADWKGEMYKLTDDNVSAHTMIPSYSMGVFKVPYKKNKTFPDYPKESCSTTSPVVCTVTTKYPGKTKEGQDTKGLSIAATCATQKKAHYSQFEAQPPDDSGSITGSNGYMTEGQVMNVSCPTIYCTSAFTEPYINIQNYSCEPFYDGEVCEEAKADGRDNLNVTCTLKL